MIAQTATTTGTTNHTEIAPLFPVPISFSDVPSIRMLSTPFVSGEVAASSTGLPVRTESASMVSLTGVGVDWGRPMGEGEMAVGEGEAMRE